jgi:hypothetical protein
MSSYVQQLTVISAFHDRKNQEPGTPTDLPMKQLIQMSFTEKKMPFISKKSPSQQQTQHQVGT